MDITVTIKIDECELKKLKKALLKEDSNVNASQYARYFDETNQYWSKDPEFNKMYLMGQQRYFTELLKSRGHLFLNEVYDALGMPRTKAGQLVGWIYDEKNPIGDNYVDFGIFKEDNLDFVNGKADKILLDFNVDGNIFESIE